jgi:uncharacterized protein YukE
MASKIQFQYNIDSKDVTLAADRTLSLKEQIKAMRTELLKTQEGTAEFDILSKKLNETTDNFNRVNAKSKELFGTFSLLPGTLGDISGQLDGSIGLLKTFSGFSLKEISTQFGNLMDDIGEIVLNILGLNKANKTLAVTTKEVAVAQEGAAVATEVNTVATEGLTVAEEGATVAAKGLGAALKAIGIGLIIAAVATLIAYWDELKDAIMGTSDVTRAYDEAQKQVTKDVTEFNTKLIEVKSALKAAENGTLSKEKALKIYNDKLGETVGYAGSLEQAESLMASNTKVVIEGIKLRAQAQIFYAKSAEAAAKAVSGEGIDPGFWQTTWNLVKSGGNLIAFNSGQAETMAENFNDLNQLQTKFAAEGDKLTAQAIKNDEKLKKGLAAPPEPPKKPSGGKDPAVQAKEQSLKDIAKLEEEGFINSLSAREKEEFMVNQKYSKAIYEAIKYGKDTATLKDLQAKELTKIAKKYDEEAFKKEIEKTRSNNQLKLAQADTLYEQMKNKYGEDSKEAMKALDDKFAAEVKVYQDELTALEGKVKAGGVLTDEEIRKQGELALAIGKVATAKAASEGKVKSKDAKDKIKDVEDEIKALDKLLESEFVGYEEKKRILQDETVLEQSAYEEAKIAAAGNAEELANIEKAHTQFLQEQADKRIQIELDAIDARANILLGYADLVGQVGSIISGLAGKNKGVAIAGVIIEQGAALAKVLIGRSAAIASATAAAAPFLANPITAVSAQALLTKTILQANLSAAISAAGIVAGAAKGIADINSANTSEGGGGGNTGGGSGEQPRKLARGGVVTGPGSSTSDSIPAMLSTGESVINAASTAMFAPLLSTINQMGGGARFADGGIAPYSSIDRSEPFASFQSEQPMIKTYVVASDMTSQQQLDRNSKNRSTL